MESNVNNSKKNKVIIAVIIAALLAVIIFLCIKVVDKKPVKDPQFAMGNVQIDTRATDEEKAANPLADRHVYFSGINDADVSAKTVVYLENLPENEDFYMTYQIEDKDTGEIVFETDLIPSGEHVEWVIGDTLTVGTHNLVFHEKPYWQNDAGEWQPLTSGNNEAVFTVH